LPDESSYCNSRTYIDVIFSYHFNLSTACFLQKDKFTNGAL